MSERFVEPDGWGPDITDYSALYFLRSAAILRDLEEPNVLVQVFQRNYALLSGVDVVCGLIKGDLMSRGTWESVTLKALPDGSRVVPMEAVLTLEGRLSDFIHLESIYLGALRTATTVATNMDLAVQEANGKPVYFMGDRFSWCESQPLMGQAALLGGAAGVCTNAMTRLVDGAHAIGTMPHALIAAFGGDVVAASRAFTEKYPEVPLVALVDFNNDCVTDALAVAEAIPTHRLWGVRLDTSSSMVDKSLENFSGATGSGEGGVTPALASIVRDALDLRGFGQCSIMVSGGFGPTKIKRFEEVEAPVDAYGVGSSVVHGAGSDFTADVVKPIGKVGRRHRPNPRLQTIL